MRIKKRHGACGTDIHLTGNEVAAAITAYLVANHVNVQGPRTIRLNEEPDPGMVTVGACVYVDPSGFVENLREECDADADE